jgi:predicted Zn-dependent protease
MSELDLAGEVLDLVRKTGAEAEAEVVVERTDYALTRFANSFIHQNVAESSVSIRLRVHAEGRTAAGSTTLTGPDALRDLVDRTLAAARLCPPDLQWPGLTGPAPTRPAPPIDEATAYAEPDARAARVRDFVAAAEDLETAGYCSTLRWSETFANTAGQTATAEAAQAVLDGIARGAVDRSGDGRVGTADGMARLAAARLAELDGRVLGQRATQKARATVDPIELPPGRYEVVLEPTAVADLLTVIAFYGLNGKAVNERRSFLEVGAAQFDPAVSIVDDPFAEGSTALPFDCEGTPRQRLAFVDAGTTVAVAHDRRTAAQAGTRSTGHALPEGGAGGAVPVALRLLPGPDTASAGEVDGPEADTSVAALVAQVERGLLVTDNWYTRVLDPRTLVVTGLTRNGLWLIENGQVTRPVQNLRFTQSYPEALAAGAVLGVGSHCAAVPNGWWEGMTLHAPALRLQSWNYTGNASG